MAAASRRNSKDGWRKSGRSSKTRLVAPERHLIVCEGTQTEPLYFEGMRDALDPRFRSRVHVVVKGTGLHTTDLFDFAVRQYRKSANGFDHVWVVYDKDDFPEENFDSVVSKCESSKLDDCKMHALWSNPCFELWLLLHFGFTTAEMTSSEAIKRVDDAFNRNLDCSYSKTQKDLFDNLKNRLGEAEINSEKLFEWHRVQGNIKPSEMNPCTSVSEITRSLADYIHKD